MTRSNRPRGPREVSPQDPDDTAAAQRPDAGDDDTEADRAVPTRLTPTGKPSGHVTTSGLEAASHWDVRVWHPL